MGDDWGLDSVPGLLAVSVGEGLCVYLPHSLFTFCHEEIQRLKMITCFYINLTMHNLKHVHTEAKTEVIIKELGKKTCRVPRL